MSGLSDAAGMLVECLSILEVITPNTTHGSDPVNGVASEISTLFTVSKPLLIAVMEGCRLDAAYTGVGSGK